MIAIDWCSQSLKPCVTRPTHPPSIRPHTSILFIIIIHPILKIFIKKFFDWYEQLPIDVYFDQCLGAVHSKHWLKTCVNIFTPKSWKRNKKQEKWGKIKQKNVLFKFAPKRWLREIITFLYLFVSVNKIFLWKWFFMDTYKL